ncbi:MAG: hypothetical protein PHO79_02150 [Desulfoplanes sp.]|nr:hypothetical protein [Desulfoplanes sp.]
MSKEIDSLGTKDGRRETLIEYLSDPGNEWPTKEKMSLDVLGMESKIYVNKTWPAAEFQKEIAGPALALRRARYAPKLSRVDQALFEQAQEGNVQAIKLVYERFENWKPGQQVELTPGQADREMTIKFIRCHEDALKELK